MFLVYWNLKIKIYWKPEDEKVTINEDLIALVESSIKKTRQKIASKKSN